MRLRGFVAETVELELSAFPAELVIRVCEQRPRYSRDISKNAVRARPSARPGSGRPRIHRGELPVDFALPELPVDFDLAASPKYFLLLVCSSAVRSHLCPFAFLWIARACSSRFLRRDCSSCSSGHTRHLPLRPSGAGIPKKKTGTGFPA
jgi:hypothetical protein